MAFAFSSDRDALLALHACLGGAQWTRAENWGGAGPISEWCGVRTTEEEGGLLRVTVLELSRNALCGELSAPVMKSVFERLSPTLEQLWLSENALTGTLPSVLALKCPNLKIIDVGSCNLRGAMHPSFASKMFNWFDVSGNQLTSYFRFAKGDDSSAPASGDAAATTTSPITTITIGSPPPPQPITTAPISSSSSSAVASSSSSSTIASSPPDTSYPALWQAHTITRLLTPAQGGKLISLAEQWASANGGWMTSRHRAYKTTDIDIAVCGGELLQMCDDLLEKCVLPRMAGMFRFAKSELAVEDLFLAKYSASKGEQRALGEHRDGSELSFVITLNDPSKDFSGGGTRFVTAPGKEDIVVAPSLPGTAVFFSGQHRHSGVEVTEGTRYIIAGFCRCYPESDAGTARLAYLKCLHETIDNAEGRSKGDYQLRDASKKRRL
jgi:hypothetical protein